MTALRPARLRVLIAAPLLRLDLAPPQRCLLVLPGGRAGLLAAKLRRAAGSSGPGGIFSLALSAVDIGVSVLKSVVFGLLVAAAAVLVIGFVLPATSPSEGEVLGATATPTLVPQFLKLLPLFGSQDCLQATIGLTPDVRHLWFCFLPHGA